MLMGTGASQGFGIGKAVIVEDNSLDYSAVEYSSSDNEKSRLKKAVERFIEETEKAEKELKKSAGESESEILEGHLTILNDPLMLSQMMESIENGSVAEAAVDAVCTMFYDMFSGIEDELMRQRAFDIKDIRNSLLRLLLGVEDTDLGAVPKGSVLVAKAFTPSMISRIKKENIAAIITETGGITSHSVILARAMGIPAVISVLNATRLISDGALLIVDGFKGTVFTNPSKKDIFEYSEKKKAYLKEKKSLNAYLNKPAATKSGAVKKVYANIEKADDIQEVIQNGGDGIGLFRTEFLFTGRDYAPTEDEQYKAYSAVAKAMGDKEVIIRTLDIGGDKKLPCLSIEEEENPFLGQRAIRYCLDNKPLFKTQLRALLRAANFGNIKILLPLITTVDEVKETKRLIESCVSELKKEGKSFRKAPVGIMIETASAAIISDLLAKEVDFFSIGTNDLTAYTMAADRGNTKVNRLCNTFQPSVLRAIEMTVKNAKENGISVEVCGEEASNEKLIPTLVEWGLDVFSVAPSLILQTRKSICECE